MLHPLASPLCVFQICLPVDVVWPWTKHPQCMCGLMLSPLGSLPKSQQSNKKIAFGSFPHGCTGKSHPEILGLTHELRLMGLCSPSDAALPARARKLPGGENTEASTGSPVSEWTLLRQSLPTAPKMKKQGLPLASFSQILQVLLYSIFYRQKWMERQTSLLKVSLLL